MIEKKVHDALKRANYDVTEVIINESSRPDLGDFQYNGIMPLAKVYHKSPLEIAEDVVKYLKDDEFFKNVNIAGPGFINISLSDGSLLEFINNNDYSYSKNGKLIFLDYGGANVAKALHVGHLRSANIGEALKRLCEYIGYDTISDTHLGDFGRPLGLVILELYKRNPDWPFFNRDYVGEYPEIEITNDLLEEIYPYASLKAKNDDSYLKEAQEMTKRLQNGERGIIKLWNIIMDTSKNDIKKIYNRLNATFDLYKGESDAEKVVPDLLKYLDTLNIVEESEGAKVINVAYEDDKLEIPPMLLIKSDGGILYSTTELATIYDRMNTYSPSEIWYIVDKRQELHFTQVFRAAKRSNIVKNDTKLVFAGFGTMNGKDGKPFKTRDGGVMKLTTLLDEVKKECLKRLNENITDNRNEIAEKIAMSAVKYADMLPNKANELNINFDKMSIISNDLTRSVILNLCNLDKVLNSAFNSKSLNDITDYIYRLTTSYNTFYAENIVLKEEDELTKESWLYLTKVVYEVNNILLKILAIDVPEKM